MNTQSRIVRGIRRREPALDAHLVQPIFIQVTSVVQSCRALPSSWPCVLLPVSHAWLRYKSVMQARGTRNCGTKKADRWTLLVASVPEANNTSSYYQPG
jgi:hypothetical protein